MSSPCLRASTPPPIPLARGSLRVSLATAFAALALFGGCRREKRQFSGGEPGPNSTANVRLIDVQPGSQQPVSHVDNPFEHSAFATSEGKRLYSSFNCSGCHAHGGGDIGPPLMDDKWIYGAAPENIYASIMEGRPNGMPSFRGHLTDDQAWKLVAYIRSMSGQVPQGVAPNRSDEMQASPAENSVKKENPAPAAPPTSGQQPQ